MIFCFKSNLFGLKLKILNLDWHQVIPEILKYWVGVSGASLTSWGEGASLALVGHPSSDGVTIKIPCGVDVFFRFFLIAFHSMQG